MGATTRRMTEADRDAAFRIYADAYGAGPATLASLADLPLTDRWVAEESGRIVALLRELPIGHSFGGRFVRSAGIAAVGVGLTDRSRGVSRALMSGVLQDRHHAGVPLSSLYWSTAAAYRPLGYELAGTRVSYQLPLEHLPREQPHEVQAWDDDDLPEVSACYRRVALTRDGMMDRPDWWWPSRVFEGVGEDAFLYRFRVREGGRTTGYVVYTVRPEDRRDFPIHWVREPECLGIVARELIWETPTAALSLLGFLAAQRTLGTNLYWNGPANDPLLMFIPEHHPVVQGSYTWMLRLVHVAEALRSRGYRDDANAEVRLRVVDGVIGGNDGALALRVENGVAQVETTADATAAVTVGGLAAMYSGWLAPQDAVRSGLLIGAAPQDLASLELLFHGSSPYLNEMW